MQFVTPTRRHFGPDASRAFHSAALMLVFLLAARILYLSLSWLSGRSGVQHFNVESACLVFGIVGFGVRLAWGTRVRVRDRTVSDSNRGLPYLLWIGLALLLYWPALHIGLLSDDFFIVERARHLDLSVVAPQFFRPVPLVIWGAILSIGGGPASLHLLNIVLHGINAYLVTRILVDVVPDLAYRALGGLILLTLPLGPEAVAWCSGIFDVLATTIICGLVLVARGYAHRPIAARRIIFIALGVAALFTKETAAIASILVLLDLKQHRARCWTLLADIAIVASIAAAFAAVRLASGGAQQLARPITRYLLQEWLFRSFGGLAVPWHSDVVLETRFLPILFSVLLIFIFTSFFLCRRASYERTRRALEAALWVLVSTLPAATTYLFVAGDLQGARYLYLPGVGWGMLLAAAASESGLLKGASRAVRVVPLLGLIAVCVAGVRLHLRYWTAAANERQHVQEAAVSDIAMRACDELSVVDLPDSYRGAYVFRNGAAEAFRQMGMKVVAMPHRPSCRFRWTGHGFTAIPALTAAAISIRPGDQ